MQTPLERRPAGALASGSALLLAPAALLFAALFFGGGVGGDGLYWIGVWALIAAGTAFAAGALGAVPLPAPRGSGLACLLLLAALAAWLGLTMWWSIAPDRSWEAFNRVLVYLAFAGLGLLAGSLVPRPARTLAGGLAALLALVLLWALAGKVVPALFPDGARVARLRNPVGYWNGLALAAATALPLGLWLAAERRRAAALRAGGTVLVYLGELVLLLTYSRGGIAVASLAVLAWLALGRERLESLAALLVASLPAAAVAAWAFSRPALTDDLQPYADRVNDGAWFGVLACAGAALVAGAAFVAARLALPEERRRRWTLGLGTVAAALALAALAAVLAVRGGDVLDEFRGARATEVTQDPTRLADLSSSNRWKWWKEAWTLFEDDPAGGTGAATFEIARRDVRVGSITTTEPHNLALQFLSETGIVGFLLLVGIAAAGAAASATALRRLEGGERPAAAALAIGVGAYLVHSLADIDWDLVAVSAPAFFSLGALVGFGSPARPRRSAPGATVAAVAALAALYSLTAPYAAGRLVDSAYDAIAAGDVAEAVSDADAARGLDPLAVDPLLALGDAEALRGRDRAALRRYEQATRLQPENSSTWYALGAYELATGRDRAALRHLDRAYGLDPYGPAGRPGGLLDQARARVEGRG